MGTAAEKASEPAEAAPKESAPDHVNVKAPREAAKTDQDLGPTVCLDAVVEATQAMQDTQDPSCMPILRLLGNRWLPCPDNLCNLQDEKDEGDAAHEPSENKEPEEKSSKDVTASLLVAKLQLWICSARALIETFTVYELFGVHEAALEQEQKEEGSSILKDPTSAEAHTQTELPDKLTSLRIGANSCDHIHLGWAS